MGQLIDARMRIKIRRYVREHGPRIERECIQKLAPRMTDVPCPECGAPQTEWLDCIERRRCLRCGREWSALGGPS